MFGFSAFAVTPFAALPGFTLQPALYTNTNTFYSATVSATYTLAPALYTNPNTFYSATVAATYTLAPALYVNTNTFFSLFAYLYPFHPNDVRPGGSSIVPGPRGPMPPAPNAARANMPLSTSVRQPMPFQ